MLVEQVDGVDAEPLEGFVGHLPDTLGAAIRAGHLSIDDVEAELGGDYYLVAHGAQRLADQFFVGVRAVDLGRIEEGDTPIHRLTDQGDAFFLCELVGITEIQTHAAEADGGYFKAARSEFARFHTCSFE